MHSRPGSDLDGLVRFGPKQSGPEARMCKNHRARCWQNTTSPLPVSHFQARLRSSTDGQVILCKTSKPPGSDLVLDDCVRFWPNGSGLEALSQCARIIRPASGQRFPSHPDEIAMGSGMFLLAICSLATHTERWLPATTASYHGT